MEPFPRFVTPSLARPARKSAAVLLAGEGLGWLAQTLHDLGLPVEEVAGRYDALAAVADDPTGYGLFALDCDGASALEQGQRMASLLRSFAPRVQVILLAAKASRGLEGPSGRRTGAQVLSREAPRQVLEHVLAGVWPGYPVDCALLR
jgi:hypothetical protein